MSARTKKFVGKGAIVAMFAVFAVVGALVAQYRAISPAGDFDMGLDGMTPLTSGAPYHTVDNAMSGEPQTTAQLTFGVEVQNYAAIYAVGAHEGRAQLDSLGSMDPSVDGNAGVFGNVGYLIVETNFAAWDILVKQRNGGYLVRTADTDRGEPGEFPVNFVGVDLPELIAFASDATRPADYDLEDYPDILALCKYPTPYDYVVDPGITCPPMTPGCTNIPATTKPVTRCGASGGTLTGATNWLQTEAARIGVHLKQKGSTDPEPVPVNVGFGSMWLGDGVTDWAGMVALISDPTIVDAAPTHAESFAVLNFDVGTNVASFAQSLSDLWGVGGSTIAFTGGATMAATNGSDEMNISAIPTMAALNDGATGFDFFGKINPEYDLTEANTWEQSSSFAGIGPTDKKGPHPAMVFFINAELDDIKAKPLMGNKNGIYTETLEFTFWGLN